MVNIDHSNEGVVHKNAQQIALISFIALLLGHLMLNTYFPNEIFNLLGLLITSLFIYNNTLRKHDVFSYIMVMYAVCVFPYFVNKGGGYNMVSFVCTAIFFLQYRSFPGEKKINDIWYKLFVFLIILSSVLGWLFNYTGKGLDFIYSFLTFFGVIFLLLISSRLILSADRVKIFIQLNFFLIIYSTLVSINKYLHIINFNTPMVLTYGAEKESYFEGGGIIGSSPYYGEYSLIIMVLFAVFIILGKGVIKINRITLFTAAVVAYINIFMSISRSVYLLSIVGLILIYVFHIKLVKINLAKIVQPILIIFLLTISVFYISSYFGLDYVFKRVDKIQKINKKSGGVTIDRVIDGSAFNREVAYSISQKKYNSRDNWLIGYGWGVGENNREAYYVDPSIKRGSAHSQIYAILFLFGWIGFIAYWGLILKIIYQSYKTAGKKNINYINRIMAFYFMIAFTLFIFNELKLDSISVPTYFAVTIIWLGLAYSANNNYGLLKPVQNRKMY